MRYTINSLDLIQQMDFAVEERCAIKSGCYVMNKQLREKYKQRNVLVPLVSSEYVLNIANTIANVSLVQTYQNPTGKFLELEYSFPIDPAICVYRFVAEFGKTRIQGIVKAKKQAEMEYNLAKSEGKKAAFGQITANNDLKLKVGNVPPNERVKIEIVYLQELVLSNNTFYQLKILGTTAPRYFSHIPHEVIMKSYGNIVKFKDTFHWSFKIYLRTTRKVIFNKSNTHPLMLVAQNDTKTLSEFRLAEDSLPYTDFIFTYTTEDFQLPSHVFGRTDHSSSAMISFIPKFCSLGIDDAYKASLTGKGFECDIQSSMGEFIFFLDRSGSMENGRIQKAKESLILFIKSLPRDSYFNVISFGGNYVSLFPQSVKYIDEIVDKAIEKISGMQADMGGTIIFKPLFEQLQSKLIEGYPKHIFLLTDGVVDDTQGVIKMVGLKNKYSRVHTIGIGSSVSRELIVKCAEKGKGKHIFIGDQENPSEKIIQLLTDSLSPVISKMKLTYDKDIVQSIIPNPQSLPYILKDQLVNFYINFKGQLDKTKTITFSYEDSVTKLPYTSQLQIDPNSQNQSFIDKMGQWKKIKILEQSLQNGRELEDYIYYVKVADKKEEIIKQSAQHQILSKYTAFSCVEKELIDGRFEEVSNVGQVSGLAKYLQCEEKDEEVIDILMQELQEQVKSSKKHGLAKKVTSPNKSYQMNAKEKWMMQKQEQDRHLDQIGEIAKRLKVQGRLCNQQLSMQNDILSGLQSQQAHTTSGVLSKVGNVFNCIGSSIAGLFSKSDKSMPSPLMSAQKSQIKQIVEEKGAASISVSIDRIVSLQSTNGSWKDVSLIGSLYSKQAEKKVQKSSNLIAVITFLVLRWIEKHYPQKQYSLVVKKALVYVKENGDYDLLCKEYQQIL